MMDEMLSQMPGLISEEAQDAMKYANLALQHQADHPEAAALFMELSSDELSHMRRISDMLAGMVDKLHAQYNGA